VARAHALGAQGDAHGVGDGADCGGGRHKQRWICCGGG
jgi:hypothetical protein